MKFSNQPTFFAKFLAIPFLTCLGGLSSLNLAALAQNEAPPPPALSEQLFSSPQEAVRALNAAAKANDQAALRRIFGPQFDALLTGDAVEDANNIKKLGAVMEQGCQCMNDSAGQATLVIGSQGWPFPVPLVKTGGQWHFDTEAGKEEIISRHIGRDELTAIGVCRTYVMAQRKYASMNPEGNAETTYARHFKSLPGRKDGLYWPAANNEPTSPFGPLVAEAQAEGYVVHPRGTGRHPFYGYYFRILTGQGAAAPGGEMTYLTDGKLTKGFAMVAYPVTWGQSGIMTFIVNQDGRIYQQNLGEQTSDLAQAMKEYNPDSTWTRVKDKGLDGVLLAPAQR